MEILILHPGALGDIVLSLPAVQVLRDRFQDDRITLAANLDFSDVASNCADRLLSLSTLPLHRLYGAADPPCEDVLLWRSFDRIVSWTGSVSELFAKRFQSLHPCVIVAAWKPDPGERRHVARLFVDSLRPWLLLPPVMPVPEIRLSGLDRQRGSEWLHHHGWDGDRPLIALHPGAGSASKRWPLEKFMHLARHLTAQGALLIVEGPAEPGLGQRLVDGTDSGARLASHLGPRMLAAVLSHCRLFVGNDSGVAHLAAAVGSPCVLIFGPTSAEHWAPIGEHIAILRNTCDCIGCERHRDDTHTCLDNVTIGEVQEAALRALARGY